MSQTLLEQSLGQLACDIPGATRIFHTFNLDFCCGGHKSLREATLGKGLDPLLIADALQDLQDAGETQHDWRNEPSHVLIAHLLTRYHARHREQLPELIRLARRVEQVHGARTSCPNGLADLLADMQQELEGHMLKEEQVLFPMLQQGIGAQAAPPIQVLRFEHDQHGQALEQMLTLTHHITPPADACNTWRALYRGLLEFKDDLMQHIHLENNVLFINALNPHH
ncbi:iron-sulfur cluster repair protein YtfE [Pseudomonas sp. B21-040]|jgi:regulator of cell morphogenesis and NO signaling|uniref:iron-sulfur cluster repair protein YtfE n=1 Tax=Pseudomonas TaxID=286 RepID=UPI0005FA9FB7|nr:MULTISPECIES: iron-sulfur cluster repair protein YtfE [Pseudomonas]KJZ39547.1 regulator of cell morphogenesis and NO signaling [Pseudomonas fluorescens]OOG11188.1 iron-sulfur cluster repair di-iron protein [Pseudomonas sp. C9]PWK35695.1 regulator of cell morphogenesis and NO signaling [Pseudomonas sp. OV226]UVL42652.1 iron-sulfur cluster repair protein YtfE [Pseudomonas sp. B21-040]